jgi:alanine-synthesizing transaminase
VIELRRILARWAPSMHSWESEMRQFYRIGQLPPYVFNVVNELKVQARNRGEDIVDFGMGNPDLPTPAHIVDKLVESARDPDNHRYSVSRGILDLRVAIADWYARRYGVSVDPEREAIAVIGVKEGLSHLALAIVEPGDTALVPAPTYPIHTYSMIIAGAEVRAVPLLEGADFFQSMVAAYRETRPRPRHLLLSFPHNPTCITVELDFFARVVEFAKANDVIVIHDFAYSDLTFDGYVAPSFLQIPGAKDVGVEFFSMSKSYNMPGWRVGFCVGNAEIIAALARMKSYLDYGMFQPIQISAAVALNGDQDCVASTVRAYQTRRDILVDGLNGIGWQCERPRGTMFVWARIPERYREIGSLEFCKLALREAKVALSPGIGFGPQGEGFVRFALVEDQKRTHQGLQGLRRLFA